jgi:hypothetical protein
MNSQFRHSLTHWLRVAEIAGFDLSQSGGNPRLRHFVPKRSHPLDEGTPSILFLVIDEFDHG